MAPPKKVVLVDGSALIFRAYFAIPNNLALASGLRTNAIYGFATMFRKLFSGRKPDLGAVVFDAGAPTFRVEAYADYKANRGEMPEDLAAQLPWIDRVVEANRFPLLRLPGFEADDIIGTLTVAAVRAGMEVMIVSADKDFAQLIGPQVRMIDTLRNVTYDPILVEKKWGVRPEQMVDLLALMGDAQDNIPGVPGIGAKGAAQLLGEYGSLDGILQNIASLKGRQKTALEEHRDKALLSRELATIKCDVPLPLGIDGLAIPAPDPRELNTLYRELRFFSLLSRDELAEVEVQRTGSTRCCATVEALQEGVAALRVAAGGRPIAVMPVYDLPSPVTGKWVGLAMAAMAAEADKGEGDTNAHAHTIYAAFAGSAAEVLPLDDAMTVLGPLLADASIPKIAHNAKELWMLCARHGVALAGVVGDAMLASFLIDPTKLIPHRLEQLVKEHLHKTLPPLKDLVGAGQSERPLSEVSVGATAGYAALLADTLARLWPMLGRKLDECGLTAQMTDLDLPLAQVLGRMELDGIRVDPDDLRAIGTELAAQLAACERRIYALAGREFNIGSTKQLGEVLFEELKLPILKRTKTGYSTDSDVLERLAPKHEIASVLVEHRKIAKLINTYTEVLQRAVNPATGRVHATFQQTVSATGRLITTEPDLQRTPVKTPEGRRIRRAFIADEGQLLVSADWSQIELRVLAHVSRDPLLCESFRPGAAVDVHRRTAAELFHIAPAAVTAEQRGIGKTVNFATIYGQGATALGQILGIPRREAQSYIDGYFAAYAGVRAWLDRTIAEAHERGYVTTLFGRRRHIPELQSNNLMDRQTGERIAANTPIQGSAADLCKLAMLHIARRLEQSGLRARMLLQVHDELVFEAPEAEVGALTDLVRHEMEHVYPLEVPLVVEVGVARSWGDAH